MAPSPAAATPAAATTAAAGGAILVTGAAGQIGAELVVALRRHYPSRVVVAGINRTQPPLSVVEPVARVDVSDTQQLIAVVSEHAVDTVYHLAAVLSGDGERDPDRCFEANMRGLKNALRICPLNSPLAQNSIKKGQLAINRFSFRSTPPCLILR